VASIRSRASRAISGASSLNRSQVISVSSFDLHHSHAIIQTLTLMQHKRRSNAPARLCPVPVFADDA
jgi:hypothetical protein